MNKALTAALLRLLRPLVRLLLRNGISYGVFSDWAKWVYVDVAEREFTIPGRKQSISRVSVLTGLNRKEVARVQKLEAPDNADEQRKFNRATRVISGWVRDPQFHDGDGPGLLPLDGEKSFSALVKRYSGDVPVRAVLDELLRVEAVECPTAASVRLKSRSYVAKGSDESKLNILGTDVAFLLDTLEHNLRDSGTNLRFQRKVAYDNLPADVLPQLRSLGGDKAQALLEELDRWLSQHDRDSNPEVVGSGRKHAGFGIYYFEEDVPEEKCK